LEGQVIVVGLNYGEFNSSACIVKDGKLIAACPEERFNRQKKTKAFPKTSLEFCLQQAGVSLAQVDYVAQAWNPGACWNKYNGVISNNRIKREDYFYTVPDHLFNLTERIPKDWVLMSFPEGSKIPPVYYIQHHRSHAANAFFLSPFEEAAILTCDYRGELECLTLSIGENSEIKLLHEQKMPHSLGMFYATYTELMGYRPDNDEWKVMALSAYEGDCTEYADRIRSTVKFTNDGLLELDQSYYKGATFDQPKLYTQKLVKLLGNREGAPGEAIGSWHYLVAKAMQKVSEELVFKFLYKLYEETKKPNLVVGGGFFMNCVLNGKIVTNTPFENIYVSYAPVDLGNSVGAALFVANYLHKQKRDLEFSTSYLGPQFEDSYIEAVLKRRSIRFQKLDNVAEEVAILLNSEHVVAHFNGSMEFGERALGNRSILGNPRDPDVKGKINSMIKYRESYRPFAPSVCKESVSEYFDVDNDYECYYMEKVVPVKSKYRDLLPAITHVDGSARAHTVREEHNNRYYNIIREFEKLSGFPIVLNTSFNINGEPIVLSPDDALSTFFNSGLQYLVMGSYLVQK